MSNIRIISLSALTTVGVLALLGASLWFGGQAIAHGALSGHSLGGGWGRHGGGHGRGGEHCERIGGHVAKLDGWLREALELTDVQAERWQAVSAHVESAGAGMQALCAQREELHQQDADVTTALATHLDVAEHVLSTSLDGVRALRPDLLSFVDSLDMDQRARVEQWLSHHRG